MTRRFDCLQSGLWFDAISYRPEGLLTDWAMLRLPRAFDQHLIRVSSIIAGNPMSQAMT